MAPRRAYSTPLLLAPIVAIAAGLRLAHLGTVPGNPFYDAAVHTMSLSWHSFLFGALDPSGGVAVDKPPVDLWVQVAAVKLLGYNPTALKLPQAIAGAASVVVLFDLVRRPFGRAAGLAAASALAVLPVAVLTARSDTMDTFMGFLVLLAAWFVVRAIETRRVAWLLAAGVTAGLAFNVKLFQALLPLPAIALLWFAGSRLGPRRTIAATTAAALVALIVAFAWIVPVAVTPASARPYPIGSTNGSIWNLVFVFNGVDRLQGRPASTPDTLPPGTKLSAALAHDQQRHTRHLLTGSAEQLVGHRYANAIGAELFPAMGVLAAGTLVFLLRWARRRGDPRDDDQTRLARSLALALGVWMVIGVVVFSAMGRFHPRYFETISPAVAAVLGGGLFVLVVRGGRGGRTLAALVVAATGIYVASLRQFLGPSTHYELIACLGAAAALIAFAAQDVPRPRAVAAAAAVAVGAVLVVPSVSSWNYMHTRAFDAERSGAMPPRLPPRINHYLASHRGSTRYSFASIAPGKAAPLIADTPQPVLMLTSYRSRPLISPAKLSRDVRAGEVRYFLLGRRCTSALTRNTAACPPTARWVIAHSTDVSRSVSVHTRGLLYRINYCRSARQHTGCVSRLRA